MDILKTHSPKELFGFLMNDGQGSVNQCFSLEIASRQIVYLYVKAAGLLFLRNQPG
jgi:hypothetical protein